ncbi:MAG: hypothetical protein AB7O91_04120 [Sphingomonas sp.]
MSRDLPEGLAAAIDEPVVRPFLAVRIEFPDPVTVWTGRGTLAFPDSDGDSREWIGAHGFGSIDNIGEASDGRATGMKVSLNQVPPELADDLHGQAVKGARFEVSLGALNETMQIVEGVKLLQKMRLDDYRVIDAGSTLTVEATGESRAIDQRRPAIKRFTDEYQQRRFPGDRFLEYLPQLAEINVLWAQADQSPNFGGAGGGGGRAYSPGENHVRAV